MIRSRHVLTFCFLFAAGGSIASATDLSPVVEFSVHDAPVDGLGDSFNATPFTGLLRKINTSQEDRAMQEFDVTPFAGATLVSATLSGTVHVNNAFDNGVRTFDFAIYAGNGVADLTDYQIAGTVVGSGSYHPPMQTSFTYSFDVTSTVQALLNANVSFVGLHVVCTSDPNFPNILDGAATSKLSIVASPVTGSPFCAGDGSATACPCGNASTAGSHSGCLNSLGLAGKLVGSGVASVASDSFVLDGTNMASSSALYFQGSSQIAGGLGVTFGDGLRCAGGSVKRLGIKTNMSGASRYPEMGDVSISVRGLVPAAGGTFDYQCWYRNAAAFCSVSTFNLTNGWSMSWAP